MSLMTWRRAETLVWVVSGLAWAIGLAALVQGRQDRSVILCVVISLGVRLLFDAVKRLVGPSPAEETRTIPATRRD
jgi:hypothetical protein